MTMYSTADKQRSYRSVSRRLRALASELGLPRGTYQLRHCYGGIAVPGEAILHAPGLYICVPLFVDGSSRTYFRSCSGLTDYVGGKNHTSRWQIPTVEEIRSAGL
jgi:hypothetical protein